MEHEPGGECRSNSVQLSAPSCRAVVTPEGVGQHILSVKLEGISRVLKNVFGPQEVENP